MIYNVVSLLGVQQSDSVMSYIYMYVYIYIYVCVCVYIFFFRFFSLIGCYKILRLVPCVIVLVGYLFYIYLH